MISSARIVLGDLISYVDNSVYFHAVTLTQLGLYNITVL